MESNFNLSSQYVSASQKKRFSTVEGMFDDCSSRKIERLYSVL